jgi:hypothetical protein
VSKLVLRDQSNVLRHTSIHDDDYRLCVPFLSFDFFFFFSDDSCKKSPRHFSPQEIGIAKIPGFSQWFSSHLIHDSLDSQSSCQKTLIFAHHLKVLDGVQVIFTITTMMFFYVF